MNYITNKEVKSRKKWIDRRLKELDLAFINARKDSPEEDVIWEEIKDLSHEYYAFGKMFGKIIEMRTDEQQIVIDRMIEDLGG